MTVIKSSNLTSCWTEAAEITREGNSETRRTATRATGAPPAAQTSTQRPPVWSSSPGVQWYSQRRQEGPNKPKQSGMTQHSRTGAPLCHFTILQQLEDWNISGYSLFLDNIYVLIYSNSPEFYRHLPCSLHSSLLWRKRTSAFPLSSM